MIAVSGDKGIRSRSERRSAYGDLREHRDLLSTGSAIIVAVGRSFYRTSLSLTDYRRLSQSWLPSNVNHPLLAIEVGND
jgi:hypothetical protein